QGDRRRRLAGRLRRIGGGGRIRLGRRRLRRCHRRRNRRARGRGRQCSPEPAHQPRTCATRHASPVLVRARRSSLTAFRRTRETLAVTCVFEEAPRTTLRTRACGTLEFEGSRGGSVASDLTSGLVAVWLKAASVFLLVLPTSYPTNAWANCQATCSGGAD